MRQAHVIHVVAVNVVVQRLLNQILRLVAGQTANSDLKKGEKKYFKNI